MKRLFTVDLQDYDENERKYIALPCGELYLRETVK